MSQSILPPGNTAAIKEVRLDLMPATANSITTTSATYVGDNRSWVATYNPANYPVGTQWYIEALVNNLGGVGIYEYINATMITGSLIGEILFSTAMVNPPNLLRGTAITMPVTTKTLTFALKQTGAPNIQCWGVRLIGIAP